MPREAEHGADELSVDASLSAGPLGNWRVRAVGLYGGALAAASALGGVLFLGTPITNAQHFVWALVSSVVFGGFLHAIATRTHIRALMERIQDLRNECHRMSDRNKELEKQVLNMRLSSRNKQRGR